MRTAIASILVFGLVIFIHEFGHFMAARRCGIRVLEFSIGMGPKLFGWKRRETEYNVRLLPIGGFCMMEGEEEESDAEDSYSNASPWKRLRVLFAGARNNIILGIVILCILTSMSRGIATTTIYSFDEGAATQASGLQVNDTILKVNGKRLFTANDIAFQMMWIEDGTADMVVRRDGEIITLKNVHFDTIRNEDGTSSIILDFTVYGLKKNIWNVLRESVCETLSLTRQIYMSLIQLITGVVPMNSLSGPVGIVEVIGEASGIGLESVLYIMAYISINLGIMNILPIPALDGGKILLTLIEGITGKKLSQKWEIGINAAGLVLLLGLMAFVTYNDISKLVNR